MNTTDMQTVQYRPVGSNLDSQQDKHRQRADSSERTTLRSRKRDVDRDSCRLNTARAQR